MVVESKGVGGLLELSTEAIVEVQSPRPGDQDMSEVFVDPPVQKQFRFHDADLVLTDPAIKAFARIALQADRGLRSVAEQNSERGVV
jgi:hypothetical protein